MSDQVYRAVFEDSVDALFVTQGTTMAYANQAMADLIGVEGPEGLVDRDASAWIIEAERDDFVRSVLERRGELPEPKINEFRFQRVDNQVLSIEASVSLINYDGRPASLFICRDVTERKAAEERAGEKERMKAQLIYTATHNLKNPLTSIKGYVEILQAQLGKAESRDPQIGEMFEAVSRSAKRLDVLINDLLEVLRIVDGRMELTMVKHNVAAFLLQVTEEMTPVLEGRHQNLKVESEVESLVFGQRLLQVLKNLIDNSSKFSPEGSTILLRVDKVDDYARFSVTDEGIGFSREDALKLFKPFPGIVKQGTVGQG